MFRRLCPWQGNKQAPREQLPGGGAGGRGGRGEFRLAAGGKERDGRCSARKGTGVKEMLTDTINVICRLPQEVGGGLLLSPRSFPSCSPCANCRKTGEAKKINN